MKIIIFISVQYPVVCSLSFELKINNDKLQLWQDYKEKILNVMIN